MRVTKLVYDVEIVFINYNNLRELRVK